MVAMTESGKWYLAVTGNKWHKAALGGNDWDILTMCSRKMHVCVGIVREGKDVPADQKCRHCARNGGAD